MKVRILFTTAFLIISATLFSQVTYTFNGNGNWSDSANWINRLVPPSPLPSKAVINIIPDLEGECILDIPLRIPANADLNVQPGKKLKVLGNLSIHYDSTIVLRDIVHVIDTNLMVSTSTASMLSQGIYQYTFDSVQPVFANGDILMGPINGGYIRKIISFSVTGNTITFQTTQGNMEDVFKQGVFSFSLATDSLLQRPSAPTSNSYSYTFNNVVLYQNGPLLIKLSRGNITLDPDWVFNFDFQNFKMQNFELGCRNAKLNSDFEVNVTASQAFNLLDRSDTLKRLTKRYTKWIFVYGVPVPVVVEMNLDFICKYAAASDASVSKDVAFTSNNSFNLGIKYTKSAWTPEYEFISNK